MTEGNKKKRYIGSTDESLCEEGRLLLAGKSYPDTEAVFSSPLKRSVETAQIIYPEVEIFLIDALRECDFGLFENKNYKELADTPEYQEWIDSGGKMDFPKGEPAEHFRTRTTKAFKDIITLSKARNLHDISIVTHGGVIMNILERYAEPKKDFYAWHVENGQGYLLRTDESMRIKIKCSIR